MRKRRWEKKKKLKELWSRGYRCIYPALATPSWQVT
jgi:hypothetical protein